MCSANGGGSRGKLSRGPCQRGCCSSLLIGSLIAVSTHQRDLAARAVPRLLALRECAAGAGSDPRQHVGERLVVRCDDVVLRRQEPDLRFEML